MPKLNAQHGSAIAQTREHILKRKPFTTHGALSAVARPNGTYIVYSYAEPIARFLPDSAGKSRHGDSAPRPRGTNPPCARR